MKEITYDDLYDEMEKGTSNMLIFGRAGSGKSYLIRKLCEKRKDIIIVAPTGIAAMNIGGRTIDSVFGFKPYSNIFTMPIITEDSLFMFQSASILLIDEISMVRFNTLDRVNDILKIIRRNELPFGGLRLLFFGDMLQLEPVVNDYEKSNIFNQYTEYNGDSGFYKSNVMIKDDYLLKSFNKYFLTYNFRQKNDIKYQEILNEVRTGNISNNILEILNNKYIETKDFFKLYKEGYHFLTLTNKTMNIINRIVIDKIPGECFISEPIRINHKSKYKIIERSRIDNIIEMKIGMKVMFVVNDMGLFRKWANGTIGTIEDINCLNGNIRSVKIKVKKENKEVIYDVEKIRIDIYGLINNEPEVVYNIINFPFLPCIATTIDKMQGMTIEKAAIVLDRKVLRPNLIYVALSRVIELLNLIILGRKLEHNDIIVSDKINNFLNTINNNLINVLYKPKIIIRKKFRVRERSSNKETILDESFSA